jgi:hypothetical protein
LNKGVLDMIDPRTFIYGLPPFAIFFALRRDELKAEGDESKRRSNATWVNRLCERP